MNNDLRLLIKKARLALSEMKDGPVIGDIPLGNVHVQCEIESWREFLVECNGGRFGAIDLWSAEELPDYQNTILTTENPSDFFVIGQVLYQPIVVNRSSGVFYWDPGTVPLVALGTADHFLSHFVFGAGYAEIVPDVEKESWWQFGLSIRTK